MMLFCLLVTGLTLLRIFSLLHSVFPLHASGKPHLNERNFIANGVRRLEGGLSPAATPQGQRCVPTGRDYLALPTRTVSISPLQQGEGRFPLGLATRPANENHGNSANEKPPLL